MFETVATAPLGTRSSRPRARSTPSTLGEAPSRARHVPVRHLAAALRRSVGSAVVDVLDTYSGHTDPGGAAARRDLGALTVTKVSVGPMDNNAYLLVCTATGEALLVDAANEPARLVALVASADGAQLRTTVTTHRHYDHWQALGAVADTFGTRQVYAVDRFEWHLKPFRAAIDAGASSVMPYYGVPVGARFDDLVFQPIGLAFSRTVVSDLLRGRLGFTGYVNSDTGIVKERAWGLENRTVPERVAAAINAGVDVLSGFHEKAVVVDLVARGLVTETRVDEAVTRLLVEQFRLGLFENPYVDPDAADAVVGNPRFREHALDAQRQSIVLLKNAGNRTLPLRAPAPDRPVRVYTLGFDAAVVGGPAYGGYVVTAGDRTNHDASARVPVPAGADYVLVRVEVTNPREVTGTYRSRDERTGGLVNSRTGHPWGADDPEGVDDGLRFGGAFPWEADLLAFSQMAASRSWRVSPSLDDIQAAMRQAGDPSKVVLCVYFRQPYVLDEASGLRNAGAILATFGVSDAALMDVLTGRHNPRGKLPFALATNAQAIVTQAPDAPGYADADTLYPFGFGLSYPNARTSAGEQVR